ncbi:MAG TPA: four helix bundle protein [Prolixibacteraceae bacterium]|nr:four helix bundle protein [Prolixibacteraceae bacterium]
MSYKKLEIWQIADELVIKIHRMTLHEPPAFEMYEEGSQIRPSSKSVKSLIVEGYGRKAYKQDFLKFLVHSMASNDETIDHLENLYKTESLTNNSLYSELHEKLEILGRKLNNFITAVQEKHNIANEPESIYQLRDDDYLTP